MSGEAPALPSLQRWMHEALVHPRRVDPGEVESRFAPSSRLTGTEGLAVYQRGYFLRIAACMREQFPALCHALGRELFDDFVADYIRERPPESHTLYDLGRRFPEWLDESRPDRDASPEAREPWVDFMIDLARFERLVFVMFDAPGHEGRPFATAATPDERLRLQPAFALGAYRFPVAVYYHEVRGGRAPPLPPADDSYYALVRTDYVTRTVPLAEPHHVFLEAMAGGEDVDGAVAAVARRLGIPKERVRSSWRTSGPRRRWIDLGFFAAD